MTPPTFFAGGRTHLHTHSLTHLQTDTYLLEIQG